MARRLASILGMAACATWAAAVPLNYALRSVPVRAGVLLIDSAQVSNAITEPANFTPFVWLNLDSNRALKPPGWNVYNPAAASTITPALSLRWGAISTVVGGTVPNVGTALTKHDAAYWEVRLTTTNDSQLAQYDVLLLAAHGFTSLNPLERERLRRFVDQGGVLWIDMTGAADINAPSGTTLDVINGLPIPFSLNNSNLGGGFGADFMHPLLNYPSFVSDSNLAAMQTDGTYGFKSVNLTDVGIAGLVNILQPLPVDFANLLPVASDSLGPILMVGHIGDGFVVMTSRGVATALNRGQAPDGTLLINQQERAQSPSNDRSAWAAAKLVINAIHLASGYPKPGQGSRGQNSSPIDVGAPLLKEFNSPLALNPGGFNYVPPVIYKGLLVVCDDSHVYVYSSHPGSDLDGDGNGDEGIPDFSLGANYDLIWSSQGLTGPISPPTCAEVPTGGTYGRDQILVQQSNGTIAAFDAFQFDANHHIVGTNSAAPLYTVDPPNGSSTTDTSVAGRGPYAPTYHEGLVFVADTTQSTVGRVWVFDPSAGSRISTAGNDWVIGNPLAPVIPVIGGSPTVGYIPIQDNSGGQDRVVYLTTRPNPSVPGPSSTAGIVSVWSGARGEKPTQPPQIVGGTQLQVITRASQKGLPIFLPSGQSRLGIKLSVIKPNGDPFTAAEMGAAFSGGVTQPTPGVLNFDLKNPALYNPATMSVRLDYSIDWGATGVTNAAVRGNLFLPDDPNRSRRIIHGLALSAQGTLYIVDSNQVAGGSLFAVREEGQGSFRLLYRYDLYPQHTITLNQADPVTYRETILDKDPLDLTVLPFLSGPFVNLAFEGGPTLRNGIVYVTARGTKLLGGAFPLDEFTILMAFKAEPEAIEIHTPSLGGGFSIVQPDMLRSPDPTNPTVFSVLQSGQFRYEQFRDTRGVIRIDNLMATTRGPMQNALSTSQPIIIRRNGQPDVMFEPDRTGSRWSPLMNYMVITGLKNQSPPIQTGETVFVAGTSRLPNLISGNPVFAPATGLVYGINSLISPSDAMLRADTDRPWMNQLFQVLVSPTFRGNPDVRWPQASGVTNFEDWRVRVLQSTLGSAPNAFGVIAGDRGLYAWTSQGVWGFSKADFLVCDEGRIARFDPSGNPIWTADATLNAGPSVDVSAASNVRQLVRATRMYPIGASDLLVVDTGADRLIRIDPAGKELRSIDHLSIDPIFAPEGYKSNETPTLREPRDVLVFTTFESNPTQMSNPQPLEYWIHYVIADTGNSRIIELVDRFAADPVTRVVQGVVTYPDPQYPADPNHNLKALGVLWWHSPASFSGKRFAYNSVARTWIDDGVNSRFVYAAGVGGALPTRADTGLDAPTATAVREVNGGNGGIVVFDGANSQVINQVVVPAIAQDVLWDPDNLVWQNPALAARRKTLGGLSSVTMRNLLIDVDGDGVPENKLAIMFTDSSGVYEIVQNGTDWVVDWMLPSKVPITNGMRERPVYTVMRRNTVTDLPNGINPLGFRATYARRLSSGEVLLVNGFTGKTEAGADFDGEVIQVDGTVPTGVFLAGFQYGPRNLGFNSLSVRFELPPIQGARGLILPVFADRR